MATISRWSRDEAQAGTIAGKSFDAAADQLLPKLWDKVIRSACGLPTTICRREGVDRCNVTESTELAASQTGTYTIRIHAPAGRIASC